MNDEITRRNFLRLASSAVVLVPTITIGASALTACSKEQALASGETKPVGPKATIVSDKERGEALVVSGTIFALDGKTPLQGATLWVYQTDATGAYSTTSGKDQRYTRIHGQVQTGADGRYEFKTIKPASYPGRTIPAHIHAFVSAPGFPEYWIDDYVFEGDPFITEEARRSHYRGEGTFASVLKLTKGGDGVLRGVRDIQIERCTNNCVRN